MTKPQDFKIYFTESFFSELKKKIAGGAVAISLIARRLVAWHSSQCFARDIGIFCQ